MANGTTLGYSLYRNNLLEEEGVKRFYARINSRGRMTEKELIKMIVERNSTVTRSEVTAVLDLLNEVTKSCLQMGFNVHTRLFKASLSVKGTFEDSYDEFDNDRHTVMLRVKGSNDLREFISRDLTMEKERSRKLVPETTNFFDFASDTTDFQVTPGNVASIKGNDMRKWENTSICCFYENN